MLYIEADSRDAAFHFAAEHYCMERFTDAKAVMLLWQTGPCAMLGSYQVPGAEIDLQAAERHGVAVVRRPSGGGTIYTDPDTFLLSIITPYAMGQDVAAIQRDMFAVPLVAALRQLGVPASIKGRNDIVANDRKITGLAQWIWRGRLCTHGSLLYAADLSMLAKILRPDEEKYRSKGLASVRGRVGNISDCLDTPPETGAFRAALRELLVQEADVRRYSFSGQDLDCITRIRNERYGNPEWARTRTPAFDYIHSRRFAAGKVEVRLSVKEGRIRHCGITGDFLGLLPISALERQLENTLYTLDALRGALDSLDLAPYLGGISREEFLSCLAG